MTYDGDCVAPLWGNRLVEVKKNSVTIAQFTYDGDGKRVKSVVDGETTLFVGSYYEQKGSQVTKYYFAGATRIAMRKYTIPQPMTVEYFIGDHLGSTSITTDASGAKVSELRYKPWGEIRYSWTAGQSTTPAYTLPQFTFTGQRSYMDDPSTSAVEGFGLMFYNARWYDPSLGRFAQADTIVPVGAQGLDRYAYVYNNPLRYNDPTGHRPCDGEYDCDGYNSNTNKVHARIYYLNAIGNGQRGVIDPNPDPSDEQGYILYQLGLVAGSENVIHIPIYEGNTWDTRWEMFGEMFEIRTWSPKVANTIIRDLQDRPLLPGEQLILVGNSGGGTVAIEALDLLEDAGIYVDQVVLRGSPVQELSLKNVGRVDYITSNFDYYYSFDVNPFDGVNVQEHQVDFWGHVIPNNATRIEVAELIASLITP